MNLVVETKYGPVEGREKDGVFLFAGIPYAAPPVGERRFRAPAPPAPWTAPRQATRFSAAAPQVPSGGMTDNAPVRWDEDCLYLNVQTPGLDSGRRPVLVWIHGGAYRTGQGAIPWYNGASFATHGDIVTVSINYRLGALGFTDLSQLGDGFETSGANGTMDQLFALAWVRDNIASFGGDPDKVTIAGESAGGFSVATLLASPLGEGLFRHAIPQSGAAHHTLSPAAGRAIAELFMAQTGAHDAEALAALPVEDILAAQAAVDQQVARGALAEDTDGVSAFYPVEGNPAIPRDPLDAIADGMGADVRVLIGTNKDESTLFIMDDVDDAALEAQARRLAGPDRAAELLAAYRRRYPEADSTWLSIALATDHTFRIPCLRLAEAREAHPESRGKTFMYLFGWESRSRLRSTHALEIPFAFNNLDKAGVNVFLGPGETPQHVADVMHDAWIRFIRDGDPGWPAWEPEQRLNMYFDDESRIASDPDAEVRDAWAGVR